MWSEFDLVVHRWCLRHKGHHKKGGLRRRRRKWKQVSPLLKKLKLKIR